MARKPKKKESRKQDKTPGAREKENASATYPLWARLIVALVIVGWVASAALFATGMQACVTMVRQATDPAFIAANLKKIARIDSLPSGFKPQLAASILNARLLTLSYEPDNSGFMIWVLPGEDRHVNARQLTDTMADKGIPTISDEFKVEKKGAILVAGEKLEYVLGLASDKQGQNVGGFIGCAILKDKRALLIYGWTPPKADTQKPANQKAVEGQASSLFNMNALISLLSAIKSF